jgi:hypothetical protein
MSKKNITFDIHFEKDMANSLVFLVNCFDVFIPFRTC